MQQAVSHPHSGCSAPAFPTRLGEMRSTPGACMMLRFSPIPLVRTALVNWFASWPAWVTISTLWGLCQLSVVLGPPATLALAKGAYEASFELPVRLSELVAAARRTFCIAWLWAFAALSPGVLLGIIYLQSSQLPGGLRSLLQAACFLGGFIWFAIQYYSLAFLAAQPRPDILAAWREAVGLLRASPLPFEVVVIALIVLFFSTLCITPLFLGIPGFLLILASQVLLNNAAGK